MKILVLLGRVLYALIFLVAGCSHFSKASIAYAASQGVPLAEFAVPLSGLMALLGGLMVAVGFKTRIGAWMLVLFLIPVTVMMHNFWAMTDPMMVQMHQGMFMKNLSMLGAALFISQMGAGPFSWDARR
jgi:putative oxidoreductase